MQQELQFEHGDISGNITVTMANGQTLDDFCVQHIPDYNRDRFEAFAIRLFGLMDICGGKNGCNPY